MCTQCLGIDELAMHICCTTVICSLTVSLLLPLLLFTCSLFWSNNLAKCLFQNSAFASVTLSFVLPLSCFYSNRSNHTNNTLSICLSGPSTSTYVQCAHGKFSINCFVASCARFTLHFDWKIQLYKTMYKKFVFSSTSHASFVGSR